ncbi:LanC-like protein 3 -like protein [Toxocara canis]|uniref:LanC-like protein 3-like protein n=1 Tax=Toxocara canis TaxID=6265 RepID=A0A0B2VGU5_TOXCA|nr:LanC-like protein 3 -like protein [Toxocara canis]
MTQMAGRSKWLPRYMDNPYLENAKEKSEQVRDKWLNDETKTLLNEICKRRAKDDDCHGGAYTGIAGIAYALLRAVQMFPDREHTLLELCGQLTDKHLKAAKHADLQRESRFLLGTVSVYVVRLLVDAAVGRSNEDIVKRLDDLGKRILEDGYQGDGDDEMLAGRAGYLAAALNLRMAMRKDLIQMKRVKAVLNKMIESGRTYAAEHNSPTPLMYQYHGREYLGAAHGLMGILQMLLSFFDLLDEQAKMDITATLDWILSVQKSNGNVASKVEDVDVDKGENELVQWCHGATGAVHLFIVAFIRFGDNKYLKAAERALDLIWLKGMLLKGPGICHGVAGSGYAFLLYYRLTHHQRYLERAKCCALLLSGDEFRARARTPDRPHSLYEGIAGTVCFLCDLVEPNSAQFPLIPIPFADTS